jgi:hypothetical protein
MNIEMSELLQTQHQANDRLHFLEEKLMEINDEISDAERCVRSTLDTGANLALEEYQMLLAYLDHKQRIRITNERQQGFARKRLEKIEQEMTQQELKIRGMENLLERRIRELTLTIENKQLSQLDEAWLQKRKEGS